MKKLLLVALTFMGVVAFAVTPTLVVDSRGEGIVIADKGDTCRVVPYKEGWVCCCFLVDGAKTVKATVSAKKATFGLRCSKSVGAVEVKSFKVNGKEMISAPGVVSKGQNFREKFEAESADGVMEMELQISNVKSAK